MPEGLILILTVSLVFVNGWTDAPNAIACAVSTGAISYRRAAWMAGACNLLGLLAMYLLGAPVTETMTSLVFFGEDRASALTALCAAMGAVVLFSVAAWWFGIPTSESHGIIAALTGAALSLGTGAVDLEAWAKVGAGLLLSVGMGYGLARSLLWLLGGLLRRLRGEWLSRMQVLSAAAMALMHGAQDGQKFVAVFVMARSLLGGKPPGGGGTLTDHLPVILLCGLTMALGTSVGGGRIVALVGGEMVRLDRAEGVCADLGGALCLLAASLWGIPISTTHTKTTAMMGAARGKGRLNPKVAGSIALAWAVTFPVCGALGWLLTRLFLPLAS